METMIDESERILVDRYIDTYVVCGGENYHPAINITRRDCEAFHVAVDTMRKYQKIEEIVTEWNKYRQDISCGFGDGVYMQMVGKVVEDGN